MRIAPDTLHPLTKKIKRARYAVVDIETKDGETQNRGFTRPFLSGLYDGESYLETKGKWCLEQLANIMLSNTYDGWIFYAHNGGGFDWLHMLPHIKELGYDVEILTVSSTIQMMHVKDSTKKSKGWMFLDSYKLIPTKLAEACDAFGVKRKKLKDHDLDLDEHDPEWSTYLRRDCEALYDVLERFHELVETQLNGEVGITAASTAMKTFRRGFQRQPIERYTEHHAFFRAAYFGGRCEIFREYGENLKYYDINSAYPWAMRHPMPTGSLVTYSKGQPPRAFTQGRIGFAWARVEVPEDDPIPVLPVRDERTGRLVFPVGRLKGYWAIAELERAQERGATVHLDRSIWIEGRDDLVSYVDTLYRYRNKSLPGYDEGLAQTSKILLNSLYGKFCMEHEREKIVIIDPGAHPPEGGRPANPRDVDCQVWHVKEEVDAPYIIPQISAYVTALARLKLHSYLVEAHENGVLCYCDTDSIITSATLSDLSNELGGIKDEGKGATYRGEFLLPKLYCLTDEETGEHKLAMKGHRERTFEKWEKVKRGETVTFEALEKIGSMARKQFSEGPQMRAITRQLKSSDEKRVHLENGATRPLYFDQWDS